MNEQHAVDRRLGQRQFILVHQGREHRAVRRPFHHPLGRRHEGETPLRLVAKQPEVWGRIADPDHAQSVHVLPACAYPPADEAPRDPAERLAVEIAQIDDIERHARNR